MRTSRVIQFLILIAVFLAGGAGAVEITNGDFEDGFTDWRYFAGNGAEANFTIVNDAYTGSSAASIEFTDVLQGDAGLDRFNAEIPVSTGDVLKVRFAAKKIGSANTRLKVSVVNKDANNSFFGVQDNFFFRPVEGSYTEYEAYAFITDPRTEFINLSFRIVDDWGLLYEGQYYIDSVSITKADLVYNGGFEEGDFGWRAYAAGGAEGIFGLTTDAYEGSNAFSFEITVGGGDHGLDRWDSRFPGSAGDLLEISSAVKKVSSDNTFLRLIIAEFDADGARCDFALYDLDVEEGVYKTNKIYHQITHPDTVKCNPIFRIFDETGQKSAGHYLVDAVDVQKPLMGFFNGGFEEDWTGWRHYAATGTTAEFSISSDAYEGDKAALMDITSVSAGSDHGLDRINSKLAVSPGDKIRLSFAAKNVSGDDTLLMLAMHETDEEQNFISYARETAFFDPGSSYGEFDFYYTIQDPSAAYVNIGFTIYNGDGSVKSAGTYLIDAVKLYQGNGLNPVDLNYDLSVNADDMYVFTDDWLNADIAAEGEVVTVDDFEGYADQAALESKWQEFYWAGFNGSNTSSTVTLLTDPVDVYEGTSAMRWDYDADDTSGNDQDYTDIVLTLDETMDLTNGSAIKIYLNRHPGNSEENLLYIKLFEGAVDVSNIVDQIWLERSEGSTYAPTGWTEWNASLDNLHTGDKSALDAVSAILIGCWSPAADGTSGSGTIDIDGIRVKYEDTCGTVHRGDFNGDCVVDMLDFAGFAASWLE
ncbi:hypothetical protein SMSP2_00571 [Limihaloglobus sulfuriphilus]|uniref:Carbohydrate binding domain protein n=1 Tax=Limihaloglobus sulfuriphilus TaxID=1851148 RepID=A0A1Q2MCF7_9BACT|nr:hypothetical protein [Limihaloglobus sulfuriphilus]AQQ70228.1 hypothetical protein SMSP2_00571 [Limihaloglobus sulfuriphilus]